MKQSNNALGLAFILCFSSRKSRLRTSMTVVDRIQHGRQKRLSQPPVPDLCPCRTILQPKPQVARQKTKTRIEKPCSLLVHLTTPRGGGNDAAEPLQAVYSSTVCCFNRASGWLVNNNELKKKLYSCAFMMHAACHETATKTEKKVSLKVQALGGTCCRLLLRKEKTLLQ